MKNLTQNIKKERVVTFLNRSEVDFLDKVGKDALFSSGVKISRAKIIEWLVDFMKELNINGKNIKSEKDFVNRVVQILGYKGSVPTSPVTNPKFKSLHKICNGTSHGT